MRKLIFIFSNLALSLAIILSLTPTSLSAIAKVEYRRIITENTPFYSDISGTNLLFNLPYTYYVKILEEGANFTHVECFGQGNSIAIDGFVPTDMLYDDKLSVVNPYLEKEITTVSTAVLYADKTLTSPIQYLFASRALKYYGQITALDGTVLFYVGYNNKLGYVEESAVSPFEIPLHPNELTFIVPETPPEEVEPPLDGEDNNEQNKMPIDSLTTIRIIVIACLILAGLIALFVALKNKPKNQLNSGYYDENEYE